MSYKVFCRGKCKLYISVFLVFFIFLSNNFQVKNIIYAENNESQLIGNLQVGDKVVDLSWLWEFRTGYGYSYVEGDEEKPVTWVVVAKDHYDIEEPHVTLIAQEVIARYVFDDSSDRVSEDGSNHWGDSGSTNATIGIRKFLNGSWYSGNDENNYEVTFYDIMSQDFRNAILVTTLINKYWDTGEVYFTDDKIFLPSTTELGDKEHQGTYEIGTDWVFFKNATSRIAYMGGKSCWYWTRSPGYVVSYFLRGVAKEGFFLEEFANTDDYGVRPVLNVSSDIIVSKLPNDNGIYEILGGIKEPEQTATPLILTQPQTVNDYKILIEGNSEPGAEIFITEGAENAEGKADFEGNFSVEVFLNADMLNVLIVKAKAEDKSLSEPATVAIIHETKHPPLPVIKYGYVLDNEDISVADAIAVLRHIVGLVLLNEDQKLRANVSAADDEITIQDAVLILRYVVGLIDKFPAEE